MVTCGFCHRNGHNRRTCEYIRQLGEKGISVGPDQIIEDFNDEFNDDSDYKHNSDESESDEAKNSEAKEDEVSAAAYGLS